MNGSFADPETLRQLEVSALFALVRFDDSLPQVHRHQVHPPMLHKLGTIYQVWNVDEQRERTAAIGFRRADCHATSANRRRASLPNTFPEANRIRVTFPIRDRSRRSRAACHPSPECSCRSISLCNVWSRSRGLRETQEGTAQRLCARRADRDTPEQPRHQRPKTKPTRHGRDISRGLLTFHDHIIERQVIAPASLFDTDHLFASTLQVHLAPGQ
jgi:hypothetical protein